MISKLAHWFYTWKHPVTTPAVENLQSASKRAADALGGSKTAFPHVLYPTSRDIRIKPQGTLSPLIRLAGLVHGRPVHIALWQNQATGVLGPLARSRKSTRKPRVLKENAILFWQSGNKAPGKATGKATGKTTGEAHVLKISLAHRSHAREIRMLKTLSAFNGLVPKIEAADPNLRWIVLEKIEAVRELSAPKQAECYVEQIAPGYFDFWGGRTRPVSRYLGSRCLGTMATPDALEAEARSLGIELPAGWQNGSMDWSITHGGGICEEILIRTDGRPCLLDWEKATLAPIGEDLLQVFEHCPQMTLRFFDGISVAGALPAKAQLAIVLCMRSLAKQKRTRINPKSVRSDRICAAHLVAAENTR